MEGTSSVIVISCVVEVIVIIIIRVIGGGGGDRLKVNLLASPDGRKGRNAAWLLKLRGAIEGVLCSGDLSEQDRGLV